ncbi:MAG: hypothetical protein C4584_01890 [Armatimonadetes bacterium]|nr:MAG: hypothetical protein C4584_01890 [Armatimonadota bacterium]
MLKKIAFISAIVIFIAIFYGLSSQVYSALQAGERLEKEVEKIVLLRQKNNELKQRLEEVKSPRFIEQQARDRLNMAKSNETIIIIPKEEIEKVLSAQKQVIEEQIPNWQGWLKLFWP